MGARLSRSSASTIETIITITTSKPTNIFKEQNKWISFKNIFCIYLEINGIQSKYKKLTKLRRLISVVWCIYSAWMVLIEQRALPLLYTSKEVRVPWTLHRSSGPQQQPQTWKSGLLLMVSYGYCSGPHIGSSPPPFLNIPFAITRSSYPVVVKITAQ